MTQKFENDGRANVGRGGRQNGGRASGPVALACLGALSIPTFLASGCKEESAAATGSTLVSSEGLPSDLPLSDAIAAAAGDRTAMNVADILPSIVHRLQSAGADAGDVLREVVEGHPRLAEARAIAEFWLSHDPESAWAKEYATTPLAGVVSPRVNLHRGQINVNYRLPEDQAASAGIDALDVVMEVYLYDAAGELLSRNWASFSADPSDASLLKVFPIVAGMPSRMSGEDQREFLRQIEVGGRIELVEQLTGLLGEDEFHSLQRSTVYRIERDEFGSLAANRVASDGTEYPSATVEVLSGMEELVWRMGANAQRASAQPGSGQSSPSAAQDPLIGQQFSELALTEHEMLEALPNAIRGDALSVTGHATLVDLWAMWCGPCLTSMPKLSEQHELWSDRDERFRVVSLCGSGARDLSFRRNNGSTGAMADWVREQREDGKFSHYVGIAGEGVFEALQVGAIPHLVLFDTTGRVVWQGTGAGAFPPDDIIEQALQAGQTTSSRR